MMEFSRTDGPGLMMPTCAPFKLPFRKLTNAVIITALLSLLGCETAQSNRGTKPRDSTPKTIPPPPVADSSIKPRGRIKRPTLAASPQLVPVARPTPKPRHESITQVGFQESSGRSSFARSGIEFNSESGIERPRKQQPDSRIVQFDDSAHRSPPVRLPEVLEATPLEKKPADNIGQPEPIDATVEFGVWTNLTTGRPDSDHEVPVFDGQARGVASGQVEPKAPANMRVVERSPSTARPHDHRAQGEPPATTVVRNPVSVSFAAANSPPEFDTRLAAQIDWLSDEQLDEAVVNAPKVQMRRITQTVAEIPPQSAVQLAAAIKDPQVRTANRADEPRITLHVDDVEVRKVFEMLSRDGSGSILVSPSVSGKVTANLEKVTQQDALNAVVKMSNLVAHREGNITFIYTADEYQTVTQNQNRIGTRVYTLNYIRAQDLSEILTPFLSKDAGRISVTPESDVGIGSDTDKAGGNSLAGGESLVVQDYESVLKMMDNIIPQLDVQPVQVVIEAVIIEAILDEDLNLGVNFGVLDGAQKSLLVAGSGAAINSAAGFIPASVLTATGGVSQGFAGNEGGVKFGFVDDDVTGFIQALEQVTEARVLASPRVLVLNKQRAELIIGERIGFKTLTVTQTSTVEKVEFLNVGTQLRLRPFVTSDRMIRLEIHPERSTGDVIDGVPRTRTNEITTNVMVPDGATIVLAGLIEEEDTTLQDGVPGLSRIPYLGALFRRRSTAGLKKELIVLITPRIWTPFGGEVMPAQPQGPQLLRDATTHYEAARPAMTNRALNINKKQSRSSKLEFIR